MSKPNDNHQHAFKRSKPTASVEICACGKWQHTEHSGPAIVAQPAEQTPATAGSPVNGEQEESQYDRDTRSLLELIEQRDELKAIANDRLALLFATQQQRDDLLAAAREAHAALFALDGQAIEFPLAKRLSNCARQLRAAIAAAEGRAE